MPCPGKDRTRGLRSEREVFVSRAAGRPGSKGHYFCWAPLSRLGRQPTVWITEAGFAAEIGSIYLLAQSKRQKLGTRLMASAFRSLAATGFEAASLWVLRDNSQARRFYESLGFTASHLGFRLDL